MKIATPPPIERAFSLTLLRILLGFILFTEGAGKLWGWFGGNGLETTRLFYDRLHVPFSPYHAVGIGLIELIGGLLLMLGLFTRFAIFAIALTMVGAMWIIAAQSGAVHNSHVIGFAISLVILQFGAGPLAFDSRFSWNKGK